MDFYHILLTAYNIKKYGWDGTGNVHIKGKRKSVSVEEWLEYRFYLFEKFCLQSVVNQTNKNFMWIIRTEDLPRSHLNKMLDLFKENNFSNKKVARQCDEC